MGALLSQDVYYLQNIVKTSNINNLILTGFIPNSDLAKYQAACDVLIMPYQQWVSASSGGDISKYLSPMKLFEYMACGKPVVASRIEGLKFIELEGAGCLVDPGVITLISRGFLRGNV
jgi:glycosyltransferase involved in cell wall biosynthesis